MTDTLTAARQTLEAHGQSHLLNFYDQLDADQQAELRSQIDAIDFDELDRLIETYVRHKPAFELPGEVEPAPYYPHEPTTELADKYARARARGEQLLREGKVAAMVVAGGSGTRLGWHGPKGTYPATPITRKPLFGVFAENLRKQEQKYGSPIAWLVMTSPANDAQTREFFAEHQFFGLDPAQVIFFAQGTMPVIGHDGKVLLEGPGEVARSADGHGGSLKALYRSGALDRIAEQGVEQISYFQVDNPLVACVDPLFIGLHAIDGAQMSSKMIPKTGPFEKLGNFCVIDGRVTVIEYSDLPDDLAEQRLDDGALRFCAGSIAIHVIAVDFVRKLNSGELALPWHRADKKVPHIDPDTGEPIEPDEPDAVKLEQFIFDALPLSETSVVLETVREQEFGPIKNAQGVDSAESSRRLQIDRAGDWLGRHGVTIPRDADGHVDATLEISPLTAVEPDDLQSIDLPDRIEPGETRSI